MGFGMAMQMFGGMSANSAQAGAERGNAYHFDQQADFMEDATERELKLHGQKSARHMGEAVGAYAASGVALSSSALEVLAGEKSKLDEEGNAIQREGEFRARLARLRAQQARRTADSLTSPMATLGAFAGPAAQFGRDLYSEG